MIISKQNKQNLRYVTISVLSAKHHAKS